MAVPVRIDLQKARKLLEDAWGKVDDPAIAVSPEILGQLKTVLTARAITYKYILITGLLGKLSNPKAHPRALQAGSSLKGAYDARSLCHRVVVSFEKNTAKNLFGLSNEPFINKPARHPEHDKSNPQLRDKELSAATHDVLEVARKLSSREVEAMLVAALRICHNAAKSQVVPVVDANANLGHVFEFVKRFLRKTDGGSRLVAVVGAFATLMHERYTVKVYPPNYSDTFAKTLGDIEILDGSHLLAAYECKQRPISLDDVRHGIRKAREGGADEYCFVFSEGVATGQREAIELELSQALDSLDVSLIDIRRAAMIWAVTLHSRRRALFGTTVSAILRDQMKRPQSANDAGVLWNSLE